jgi:hypothetical protein
MSANKFSGKQTQQQPDGRIRQSQMVGTFGPGAMLDLVQHAVLVSGLDFWDPEKRIPKVEIAEPRLRESIAARYKELASTLSLSHPFRVPPAGNDREPAVGSGVQVLEFPHWFVCQNKKCCALQRASDGLKLKNQQYVHQCDGKTVSPTVPVRFVTACKKGHLDDFEWIRFAHHDKPRCGRASLTFEEGASGDFHEIEVHCQCGAFARLSQAMTKGFPLRCTGERPWLGREGKQDCDEQARLLVRTATNSYFAQTVSALSIPDPDNELMNTVKNVLEIVKYYDEDDLRKARIKNPTIQQAFERFSDSDVLRTIEQVKSGITPTPVPLRTAEFKQFTAAADEKTGEVAGQTDQFFARKLADRSLLPDKIATVVLASKLREVIAQIGFTRLEPSTADLQGEYDLKVESAQLRLTADWLPAAEVLGEGIFLQLHEPDVQEWERRVQVEHRTRQLLAGYEAWTKSLTDAPPFFGARYYLLHSLSHLLITAISLECGYAASAIRERIYCSSAPNEPPMAAILLHTGTTGSQGTLGGLVEQGRRIKHHLLEALTLGELCSNDPVCASHSPEKDHAERFLEGAACHGCLFIAENSCERFNRYLDRSLVVPTIGHPPELAFFSAPTTS